MRWKARRPKGPGAPDRAPRRARTFVSDDLEARFVQHGFVVVPLLDPADAVRLRQRVIDLCGPSGGGFVDLLGLGPSRRAALSEVLVGELGPLAAPYFLDHDLFMGTPFLKHPGERSEKALHMDWSMVDEARYASGIVWVALDHATARNGGLRAVPGSNRLDVPHRGSPDVHFPVAGSAIEPLLEARSVDIDVPLGHAAIFDHRLLHGGHGNDGAEARVAVGLGFKPRAASLLHYRVDRQGRTHRYEIEPRFLLEVDPSREPEGAGVLGHVVLEDRQWALVPGDLACITPDGGAAVGSARSATSCT